MQIKSRSLLIFCLLLTCTVLKAEQANRPALNQSSLQAIAGLPAVTGAASVSLADITNKPLLVTFFASWCPPCREEFTHLNKLQEKYADTDLGILAINVYEAWDENDAVRMQKFISTTQPQFPALKGSEEIRELFGGIDRIPTVLGFDQSGNPAYHFIHKRGAKKTNATFDELDKAAAALLAAG